MAWVETRITRTTQPQDAVGIADGFLKGLIFAYNGGTDQLAQEGIGKTSTGTKSRSVGAVGKAASYSGTNQFTNIDNTQSALPGGMTFLYLAKRNVATSVQPVLIKSGGGTGFESALYNTFGSPPSRIYSSFFNGSSQVAPTSGYVNGKKDSLNGTFDTVTGGFYAVAGTCSSISQSTSNFEIARAIPGGPYYGSVDVVLACAWRGIFSEAVLKSITENPWQIFEPEVIRIWVDDYVSAGGGATVIPIGVQATGSVGTPSATGAATVTPAGVSASSAVGTPVALGGASIPATVLPAGVQATGAVGTVSATGAAVAQPAGVTASGAVGTPVAIAGTSIPATVLPAGVQASSAVGTPAAQGAAIAQPLGVAATAYVGTPTIATGVSGVAVAYPAGVQAIGQVGTLIATGAAWTAAVGVQAVASVGTPTAYAGEIVIYVAGAQTRPSRLQSSSRPSRLQTGTRASR